MEYSIRRAQHADAGSLIAAHRRSIREVCSADYNPDQIAAWSGRPFQESRWQQTRDRDLVWVISNNENQIFGFGHLAFRDDEAEVMGLYFVPEVQGLGFGKAMMKLFMQECRARGIKKLVLSATKTAKRFYERAGFHSVGDMAFIELGGQKIECFEMHQILK